MLVLPGAGAAACGSRLFYVQQFRVQLSVGGLEGGVKAVSAREFCKTPFSNGGRQYGAALVSACAARGRASGRLLAQGW